MKENHLALFCRVSKGSRTSLTFCCAYSDSDTVLKFAICCSMAVRQTHCFALNDGLDHFSSNISILYYTADPSQQASRCNVLCMGHMASDSIGFNQILDAWEARGVEVTRIGGLV